MSRLRRNHFALTPPTASPRVERERIDGRTVIGIVANPKTCEPALVVTDGTDVGIRSLRRDLLLEQIGRGYYEESSNEPSRATGLPRSHTPSGVTIKGQGWGTSLYTALVVGSEAADEDLVQIEMWKTGGGICSWTDDRSAEADRWWAQAVRLRLAEQVTEEESEKEEDVDLNLDPSDLDRFVDEGTVVYVNQVSVDIEKTSEKNIETYELSSAVDRHHLISAVMAVRIPNETEDQEEALDFLWRALREDPDQIHLADSQSLLALDVRQLSPAGLHLVSILAVASGFDGAQLDELRLRHSRSLDPKESSRQGRLFTPNQSGIDEVDAARQDAGWPGLAVLP